MKRTSSSYGAVMLLFAFNVSSSLAATRAPWLSLLMALDRGYRPGIEELHQLAAVLADAPREVLIAWDRQGQFLFHAVGESHRVPIRRSLAQKLKGSVVIHNHPNGLPPSRLDLDTVRRYGLRRLYVTARIDGVISLTDLNDVEALRQSQGRNLVRRSAWRPVVATTPSFDIEGTDVLATQIAYSLLGAWL